MKKIIYGILATISGLVLLLSYRTSLGETISTDVAPIGGSATTTAPSANSTSTSTSGASTAPGPGLKDGTYTGSAVNTRYGSVVVQITVSGGAVTDVQVPEYPSGDSRDRQINSVALPRLVSETLNAQSAHIDMVSGATYTSDGYRRSLQSALDRATP